MSLHRSPLRPTVRPTRCPTNKVARLWDGTTGREIRRFPRSNRPVRSLCFAPDGKTLAGAYGHPALLLDVATGRKRWALDHPDYVNAVAFAPEGTTLATGDNSGRIRLWDAATPRELSQFGDHPDKEGEPPYVTSLAFLHDGKSVAVAAVWAGGADPSLRLWDTHTGKVRRRLEGHANFVYRIAVALDGKTMASASADGTTLIWDVTKIGKTTSHLRYPTDKKTRASGGRRCSSARSVQNDVLSYEWHQSLFSKSLTEAAPDGVRNHKGGGWAATSESPTVLPAPFHHQNRPSRRRASS